ncbi:MAG: hypothetical protein ACK52I_29670 [Pseudomonadota bacterium]
MEKHYLIKITTPDGILFEVAFGEDNGQSAAETLKLIASFVELYGMDIGMLKATALFQEAAKEHGFDVRETDEGTEVSKGIDK